MGMMIMMALPKLNIELLVMTMLVILLTMQMKIIVLYIMYMETMVRMLQLLLLLSSCSSRLLSTCKNRNEKTKTDSSFSKPMTKIMMMMLGSLIMLLLLRCMLHSLSTGKAKHHAIRLLAACSSKSMYPVQESGIRARLHGSRSINLR